MSGWKACDIRGPYPDEVSAPMFSGIGAAVAVGLPVGSPVLVSGDFRPSTLELKAALIAGLVGGGARVLDAGQIPTPVAYFAEERFGAVAAFIVTASHNPPGHNGLKLSFGGLPPTEEDLAKLRTQSESPPRLRAGGSVEACEPLTLYREWILSRWAGATPLTVVLDAGNGCWSEAAPRVFELLGYRTHRLFCTVDGTYPNRPPDSARPQNLGALRAAMRPAGAQLGVAWDGDGDRVSFVDETGSVLSADQTSMLLLAELLSPGDRAVYDLKMSDAVRRTIAARGAQPLMERSGHAFIRRRMVATGARAGCEVSGHYFHRELNGRDDGLFTALLMARLVAAHGPLSKLREELPRIYATPDLRLPGADVPYAELVRRLRTGFPEARETTLDGLRLEAADGFILLRQSVTEAALTLRIEGFDAASFERLTGACLGVMPELEARARAQMRQTEGT